jgi:hypothetical protein
MKKTVQALNIQELIDIDIITKLFRNKDKEKERNSILKDFEKQLRESLKVDIEIEEPKVLPLKISIPSLGKITLFVTGFVKKKFSQMFDKNDQYDDQGN